MSCETILQQASGPRPPVLMGKRRGLLQSIALNAGHVWNSPRLRPKTFLTQSNVSHIRNGSNRLWNMFTFSGWWFPFANIKEQKSPCWTFYNTVWLRVSRTIGTSHSLPLGLQGHHWCCLQGHATQFPFPASFTLSLLCAPGIFSQICVFLTHLQIIFSTHIVNTFTNCLYIQVHMRHANESCDILSDNVNILDPLTFHSTIRQKRDICGS